MLAEAMRDEAVRAGVETGEIMETEASLLVWMVGLESLLFI